MIKRLSVFLVLVIGCTNCSLTGYEFQYLCFGNGKVITKIYNDRLTDYFVYGRYDSQSLPDSYISVSYSGRGGYVVYAGFENGSCVLYHIGGGIFNVHKSNDKLKLNDSLYSEGKQRIQEKSKASKNCEFILIADYSHADITKQNCQCK
ncbi:hypothetical protein [uncultured Microscilla sp.]|uniref:hypothetical protein n=1 Tax=uncultured Microscilla sp. TaxID=432653 RepID=UPI002614E9F2|nr:hypothetical protein [uncultured Microscilla sp.]